jgi:hypothetical protein
MINLPYVINLWFLLPRLRYILQNPDDPSRFICKWLLLPKLYYIFQSVTIDFPLFINLWFLLLPKLHYVLQRVTIDLPLLTKLWFLLTKLYYIMQTVTIDFPLLINLWFLLPVPKLYYILQRVTIDLPLGQRMFTIPQGSDKKNLDWTSATDAVHDFLGPNGTHCRAQKSLDFQGPPLPMHLVMMLHASKSLRTAPYKQQVR